MGRIRIRVVRMDVDLEPVFGIPIKSEIVLNNVRENRLRTLVMNTINTSTLILCTVLLKPDNKPSFVKDIRLGNVQILASSWPQVSRHSNIVTDKIWPYVWRWTWMRQWHWPRQWPWPPPGHQADRRWGRTSQQGCSPLPSFLPHIIQCHHPGRQLTGTGTELSIWGDF
jgi:hypothetical protein